MNLAFVELSDKKGATDGYMSSGTARSKFKVGVEVLVSSWYFLKDFMIATVQDLREGRWGRIIQRAVEKLRELHA